MKELKQLLPLIFFVLLLASCKKDEVIPDDGYVYFEVGFDNNSPDWRDTAFIVRTKNRLLIHQADSQLALPFTERQLVVGTLAAGSAGYNKNASHEFKWHIEEDAWSLADFTIEIYDGKPYTDVDQDIDYWLNNVKGFGPWSSYIKRRLPGKP